MSLFEKPQRHADDEREHIESPDERQEAASKVGFAPRVHNGSAASHAEAVRRKRREQNDVQEQDQGSEGGIAQAGLKDPAGPLPHKAEFESQLGADLGGVKVHTGPNATEANAQLGADAYTVGDHIALGEQGPDKKLLAHEVAHVVQNTQSEGPALDAEKAEEEADTVADDLDAGKTVDSQALGKDSPKQVKKKGSLVQKFNQFVGGSYKASEEETSVKSEDHLEDETTKETTTLDRQPGGFSHTKETEVVESERDAKPAKAILDDHRSVAAERDKLKDRLSSQSAKLRAAGAKATVDAFVENWKKSSMESELGKLEELDDFLAAGKIEQLKGKIKKSEAKIKAYELDVKLSNLYADELDAANKAITPKDTSFEAEAARLDKLGAEYRKKVTKKRKLAWNASFTGTLSRTESNSKTQHLKDGEIENSTTDSHQVEIKEGIKATGSTTKKNQVRDETGKVIAGEETTVEHSHQAIYKKDGTVGVGAQSKMRKALENSHGKVYAEGGGGGAYTVNIVPIPKSDEKAEQQYAVVCTLNLNIAATLGAEKEIEDHKKDEDKTGSLKEQGKAKGGMNASGSAEASFTHTRTMDADAARAYLANLEKAGNGEKVGSDKPEFSILAKVMAALKNSDDAASAVTAAFGDSEAAKEMAVDESIEFTTKVSGSVGANVGAENKEGDKSASASGSAGGSLYRTMKIGRVSGGAAGQELVDITVAFGSSSEFAGAMSASALGVTASAGGKQWKAAETSVKFRLDASLEDEYKELYEDIVSTTSPSTLMALRKSPKYGAHVLAYREKESEGTSAEMGAKSVFGLSGKTDRQSSKETIVDEHGKKEFNEKGSSTHSMTGSVGPLDVWKNSRKDEASFSATNGSMLLDISQETDETSLGIGDMPSIGDAVAEGPKSAIEKAITENHKELRGKSLDPADIDILVSRARSPAWWNAQYNIPGRFTEADEKAWSSLKSRLTSGKPAEGFSVDEIVMARQLERGRALVDFMRNSDNGFDLLDVVLRNFQKAGGDGKDIGTLYEWPLELTPTMSKHYEVRKRVGTLKENLAAFIGDEENGPAEGMEFCTELQADIAKVIAKIRACGTFDEPRAKVEMINELYEMGETVHETRRSFLRTFDDSPLTEEDASRHAAEDARIDVKRLHEVLGQGKAQEFLRIREAEVIIENNENSTFGFLDGNEWFTKVENILEKLEELYDFHIKRIKELRLAYIAAETPESEQMVSKSRRDDSKAYDVDWPRAEKLWKALADKYALRQAAYPGQKEVRRSKYWLY